MNRAVCSLVPPLAAALLLVGSPSRASDPARLSREVRPTLESVQLDMDARLKSYSGSVTIELSADAPVDSFRLHARDMTLQRVTLRRGATVLPVAWREGERGLLTVLPARRLETGPCTLTIDFTNDFDTRAASLYRVETGGNAYAFTQFEPDDARGAFPCFDEPSFKIPWQLTVTVPREHIAIANTLVEHDRALGERHRITFHRTPPLPSYLVAIATGPLETVPIPGLSVPGRIVTVKGSARLAAQAAKDTPAILAALERYFGRPYPYEKLDLIGVPEFTAGAMENAGAITFREEILLMDPTTTAPDQRRGLIVNAAHELAHMWFGDLVTMSWWDDLWLNESFASWMGAKVTDQVAPEFHVAITEVSGAQGAMTTDSRLTARAIRADVLATDNFEESFDNLAYEKGEAVLGMLERWLGPETFRRGVVSYIAAHASGNAVADDLWRSLGAAARSDVQAVAKTFLDQPGVPLVSAEPLAGGRVRLSQRRSLNLGVVEPGRALWRVPVTLRYPARERIVTQNVVLEDSVQTFALDGGVTPAWIHPNADEEGYYRWSLPPDALDSLAHQAERRLSIRERVGFLGNARALLLAGRMHGDQFAGLLAAFGHDPEPEVIEGVLRGLETLVFTFRTPGNRDDMAAYVRRVLQPALERYGTEPAAHEPSPVTLVRPWLLTELGDKGEDPQVVERGRALAASYMKDRTSIDPSLADAAVTLAGLHGDATLFEEYRRRFEGATVPDERQRYLSGLGSFTDPALVRRALEYVIVGPLRPQEIMNLPGQIGSRLEYEAQVQAWVMAHYDTLAARIPNWNVVYFPWYGIGCSNESAERSRAFYSQPAHGTTGTAREVDKMLAWAHDCAALHDRDVEAVTRYLVQTAAAK
jgi:alanyl aminopeptidase